MSEWRPIETAPKDGTWFLVCRQETLSRGAIYDIIRWDDGQFVSMLLVPITSKSHITPTHWQPLPPPPEEKK